MRLEAPSEADATVGDALSAGWRAVRGRPAVVFVYGGIVFALAASAWVAASLAAVISEGSPAVSVALVGVAIALSIAAGVCSVGYSSMWLRIARGEPAGLAEFLSGWRRLPAVVVAGVLASAAVIGAYGIVALGGALPYALGATTFDRVFPVGASATGAFTVFLSVLVAVAVGMAAIGAAYLAAGVSQWPFLVTNGSLGGAAAVKASWAIVRNNRLVVVSMAFATLALWMVGLAMLGVGVVLTVSVAFAAHAALHERLLREQRHPAQRHPARATDASGLAVNGLPAGSEVAEHRLREVFPDVARDTETAAVSGPQAPATFSNRGVMLPALAVDAVLATWLVATVWIVVLAATVAPIVDWAREAWPAYGTRLLLMPIVLPALVTAAVYVAVSVWRGSPGRRVVGRGWGRSAWLALGLLPLPLALAGAVNQAAVAVGGVNALAVGQEMAREVTADLPSGYGRSLDEGGSEDWFRIMDLDDDGENGFAAAYYTVTDPAGTEYHFRLATYFEEDIAQEAHSRLTGTESGTDLAGGTVSSTGSVPPGLARRVALWGGTVLAGEGPAAQEAELETLMQLQVERIAGAREHVAPVYESLPRMPQQLRDALAAP